MSEKVVVMTDRTGLHNLSYREPLSQNSHVHLSNVIIVSRSRRCQTTISQTQFLTWYVWREFHKSSFSQTRK